MEAILKHPDERSYYSEMDLCVLRKEGSYKTGQNMRQRSEKQEYKYVKTRMGLWRV